MLRDVERLYNAGLAIHWLKSKSKVPVQSGWTSGPRTKRAELEKSYRVGMNVGVRLGEASKLGDGKFLAVIDCDVKSKHQDHVKEMRETLKDFTTLQGPIVKSGRGNGSMHVYVKSEKPVAPTRLARSNDIVKVHMPSISPSKKERAVLSDKELKDGWRLRPAWEISLMGQGQQVVLPPSIHPDSGKPYKWLAPFDASKIPLVKKFKAPEAGSSEKVIEDFKPEDVDLAMSNLSDEVVGLIVDGENCDDRSAAIFKVSMAMVKENFTTNQIKSVLTDPEYFLGQAAYEHAKTKSRKRAAEWVERYTLKKAKKSALESDAFDAEVEEVKTLGADDAQTQAQELLDGDWRLKLSRNKPTDPPRPTMQNIKLILENVMELEDFIARNDFAIEDVWTADTPWGNVRGAVVTDNDTILIKEWLGKRFRVEPAQDKIEEVLIWFAIKNRFHPVREYLDGLRWDGVRRLDRWLENYLSAKGPSEYLKNIGRKTLVAMVGRIYEPGCKFDNVLILEGEQGIGKSSTARILAGDEWFSDSDLNIGDKDSVVNMQGIWVYELGELSAMSRYDVNRLKEFISRSTDKIRPPYGKRTLAYPRQSIFIGTTNNTEYLKDKTGNRRYWPVECGEVDMDGLRRDRDQLLAEAVECYLGGEDLWLSDKKVLSVVQREQGLRVEHDELEDDLQEFLESPPDTFNLECFRIGDVFVHAPFLNGAKSDRQTQMRIANALKSLGFESQRKRVKKVNAKWWSKRAVHTS